jgi:hypothetical protein
MRKIGYRFCELFHLLLIALLALQFYLWWCLRNDRQITLPGFVAGFIQQRVEAAGVACHFREIVFRPNGYLEVEDVELGAPGAAGPTFVIKRVAATMSVPWLLRGRVVFNRAILEGGDFYCPASVAPDGHRGVVVGDIRAVLDRETKGVRAQVLQARYGKTPIVIYGDFIPRALWDSVTDGKSGVVTPEEWTAIHRVAGQMLNVRKTVESIGKVFVEARGRSDESGAVTFSLRALGAHFELPLPGQAHVKDAQFRGRARFDGVDFQPVGTVVLTVGAFEWKHHGADGAELPAFSTKTGPVRLSSRLGTKWELPTAIRATLTDLVVNGEHAGYLAADVKWEALPEISAEALIVRGGDFVEAHAKGNFSKRSGKIDFSAQLTPSIYLAHPAVKTLLKKVPAPIEVGQHLALDGFAEFAPGGKFARSEFFFDIGAVRFGEINANSGKGRVKLTPDGVIVEDADVRAANYGAKGSFRTGFAKGSAFRFLLEGSIHPGVLDFIGPSWVDLWQQFNLRPESLPRADIEIHGNWGVPYEFIYCGAAGERITFRGAEFDHASLRILETPQRVALFKVHARQGIFNATGDLHLNYSLTPHYKLNDIRFLFTGRMPKETGVLLAGGRLSTMLAPLRVSQPVDATVTGCAHIANDISAPERTQVLVSAKTTGAINAWNLPFSDFQGTVAYDTGRLAITVNDVTFAGGKIGQKRAPWLSARPDRPQYLWLDLNPADPLLQFDLELLRARRSTFLENLQKINATPPALAPVPAPALVPLVAPEPPPTETDDSALDIALTGSVSLPKLETLDATGTTNLLDNKLAQLHIFGGLSRALDKINIGFSSFKLTRAESNFTIREKIIYFPNIKITGENASIDSVGRFYLDDQSLKFRAQLVAKSGEGIPGIKYVFRGLNKWTELIPVNISGTLKDPQWSIDISPTALFTSPLNVKEGTAPKKESQPTPAPETKPKK